APTSEKDVRGISPEPVDSHDPQLVERPGRGVAEHLTAAGAVAEGNGPRDAVILVLPHDHDARLDCEAPFEGVRLGQDRLTVTLIGRGDPLVGRDPPYRRRLRHEPSPSSRRGTRGSPRATRRAASMASRSGAHTCSISRG